MNMSDEKLARLVQQIMQEIGQANGSNDQVVAVDPYLVPIGVSNRHVHLSRSDMDTLFGSGSSLTRMKAVKQPGQFAAQETVILKGPKKEIKNVRVLGPLRAETQVEISVADSFVLGVPAEIRMSGNLADTPGIEIIGPYGSVKKDCGVIVAWRHIHVPPEMAQKLKLTDGQEVDVEITGKRAGVMQRVLVRATESSVFEMHVDVEEANAYGLANEDLVRIKKLANS